jgi:hypothetical protein
MKAQPRAAGRLLLPTLAVAALCALCAQPAAAQGEGVDRRKLTSIQTAAADVGSRKHAVEVRYLNLPFGEATFGYVETGQDPRNGGYYSGRTWPVAHLRLSTAAAHDGKTLAPGDYVVYITPRNPEKNTDMTLAVASFKPAEAGGTFLKAGDVFAETPKDAQVVSQKAVKFARGASKVEELQVWVGRQGKDVEITFHYGDRKLTERLKLK